MASDYEEIDAGRRTTAARRSASLVSICLLGASTAAADQAGDAYVAIDLTPAGFVESQAAGVSSGRQVGFGFGGATFGAEHALLWAGGPGSAVDLHPAGYVMSNALGASGIRQVGWASAAETGVPHAFLWSGSAASGVDLQPPDFTYSRARGIFGDVQVGSGAGPATGFSDHALLWTGSATSVIDLNPPGFFSSEARAASENQQVGVGNIGRALLWTGSPDSAIDLTPFWCLDAEAFGVSDGQQVGRCRAAPDFNQHALLWAGSAESVVDLHPASYFFSEARGVANGRQVGFGAPFGGSTRALVWAGTPDSVIDLNQFLPPGFSDAVALGIDERGNIVGWAREAGGGGFLHAFLWTPVAAEMAVTIDIKPGSDVNSIQPLRHGVVSVGILTTDTLDATTVDVSSVRFGPTGATEAHGQGHVEDVNGDGRLDVVLHFRTDETGIQCGDTMVSLTGTTVAGQSIEGSDSITTVGCK